MTRVAVVLVTSNSARWIQATLDSVLAQSRQPDEIVVVDDRSSDSTRDVIHRTLGTRVGVIDAETTSSDRSTRIAQNFRQGLQAVRAFDVAVLGDHDDQWHPNRIGHQVGVLETWQQDAMLASDGRLVDASARPTGGTLRSVFPVPIDWPNASAAMRMRAVIRYSVATGGACAVRPAAFADIDIPVGWLHDRWWSLVAAAREQLIVDNEIVIDYRLSATQQVGLDRGRQATSTPARAVAGVRDLSQTLGRVRDIRSLARVATARTASELTLPGLLRNLA